MWEPTQPRDYHLIKNSCRHKIHQNSHQYGSHSRNKRLFKKPSPWWKALVCCRHMVSSIDSCTWARTILSRRRLNWRSRRRRSRRTGKMDSRLIRLLTSLAGKKCAHWSYTRISHQRWSMLARTSTTTAMWPISYWTPTLLKLNLRHRRQDPSDSDDASLSLISTIRTKQWTLQRSSKKSKWTKTTRMKMWTTAWMSLTKWAPKRWREVPSHQVRRFPWTQMTWPCWGKWTTKMAMVMMITWWILWGRVPVTLHSPPKKKIPSHSIELHHEIND